MLPPLYIVTSDKQTPGKQKIWEGRTKANKLPTYLVEITLVDSNENKYYDSTIHNQKITEDFSETILSYDIHTRLSF